MRQLREVLMAWARLHGRGEPPEIMTMAGFVRSLGRQILPDGWRILPDASVDVLLRYAAQSVGLRPGALRVNAARLSRWAQEGASAGSVRQLANSVDGSRRSHHLETVSTLWNALLNLTSVRACDRGTYAAGIANEASRRTDVTYTTPSGDVHRRLFVLDTHGITFTDRMLLHALGKCQWDIAIAFAPELDPAQLQATSRSNMDQIWLVSHGWTGESVDDVLRPRVTLRKFPTRVEEVRRALAMIKEGVEQGIPLDAMAICIPGIADYQRLVHETATFCGVPVDLTLDTPLASTRTASAVHSACQVIMGLWERNDVERLLRDPLVRASVRDVAHLLKVALEERIIGGQGSQAWIERCERRHADAVVFISEDSDNADEWERKCSRYKRAINAVRLLQPWLAMPHDQLIDADQFSSFLLKNICGGLGIFERAVAFERSAIVAFEESLSSYCALAKDHSLPRVYFAAHLRAWWTIVQSVNIPQSGRSPSGVAVVRPAELRGRHRRLVIAIGCVEGEFPRTIEDAVEEDIAPGLRSAIAIESMADICASVGRDGLLVCTYPETLDGDVAMPTSLLDSVLISDEYGDVWKSLDRSLTLLLHSRDVRVRSTKPPDVRTAQQCHVLAFLDDEAKTIFNQDILRPLSPSRLDVFIQCPFKYHAQKTLRLNESVSDDLQLTPMERGSLLHNLVQRFYRSYQPEGEPDLSSAESIVRWCVDLRTGSMEDHWQRLLQHLDEVLRENAHDHLYAEVERRALVGTPQRAGLLRRWLANEIKAQDESKFLPVLFEREIEVDIDVPFVDGIRAVRVKTRIDRIDVLMSERGLEFVVNDYKSTIAAHLKRDNVISGIVTQMPIYLMAVQAYFSSCGIEAYPAGAIYRAFGNALKSPDATKLAVVLADPYSIVLVKNSFTDDLKTLPLPEQLERIMRDISPAILDIRSGSYPVRPTKEACKNCNVSALCRIDQWGQI